MAAKKSAGKRKYGKAAGKSVERAMKKRAKGTLKSGSGGKVKSREQAIAIGLSEAREKGAKVPRKRTTKRGGAKKAAAKKSSSKSTTSKRSSAKKATSKTSTSAKRAAAGRKGERKTTAKKRS